MFASVMKKIVFAFAVSVLLFFSFHKAVAAELTPIDALPTMAEDRYTVVCSDLKVQAAKYKADFLNFNQIVTEYFNGIGHVLAAWHETLAAKEGQLFLFPEDYFSALPVSSLRMADAASILFSYNLLFDENLAVLVGKAEECIVDSQYKTRYLENIRDFQSVNYEHLSTPGDFLSQLYPHAEGWYSTWRSYQGKEVELAPGYFSAVSQDAEGFSEAAFLIGDSSSLLMQRYDQLLNQLNQLAIKDGQP